MDVTTEHPQSGRPVPQAVPFDRQVRSQVSGPGTALSVVVHLALIAALLWATSPHFLDASRGIGAGAGRGGGGGGGGNAITALAVVFGATPPAPPPVVVEQTQVLAVPATVEPIPETRDSTPKPPPADTATAQGAAEGPGVGPGQGPGVGPGSGGGSGGGAGGGIGPGVGPDSGAGGGGGTIIPPQPMGIILPPPGRPGALRGVRITVTFFISERGDVVRVEVDPPIRDRGYRNEFLARMRRYTFTPAYTRDGRPVASAFPFQITL